LRDVLDERNEQNVQEWCGDLCGAAASNQLVIKPFTASELSKGMGRRALHKERAALLNS
jgi:hypothetical protein